MSNFDPALGDLIIDHRNFYGCGKSLIVININFGDHSIDFLTLYGIESHTIAFVQHLIKSTNVTYVKILKSDGNIGTCHWISQESYPNGHDQLCGKKLMFVTCRQEI